MPALSRRQLLGGMAPAGPLLPWTSAAAIAGACTRCGACASACAQGVIAADARGYPLIDFSRGGCSACGACREVCEAAVFDSGPRAPLWPWLPLPGDRCLPRQGVVCQSCRDACEAGAIRFPGARPVAAPAIDHDRCTRCGMCIGVCPVEAIAWTPAQ